MCYNIGWDGIRHSGKSVLDSILAEDEIRGKREK